MPARLTGDKNQFWNNLAVGAGDPSAAVNVGRGYEQFVIFVTSSGVTNITVEVAHQGDITSEGILPDDAPGTWHPLSYLNDAIVIAIAGAGSKAVIIPDLAASHIRLRSSAAMTLTAGWSASAG